MMPMRDRYHDFLKTAAERPTVRFLNYPLFVSQMLMVQFAESSLPKYLQGN